MLLQILKKLLTLPLIFNGTSKILSILHQTHSNSPFYWNMNSANTRSIPNYTKCIPDCTRYIPKVSEMLKIRLEHGQFYTRHNPMARVSTICIPTPPRSSHIAVGRHLMQGSQKCAKLGPANRRRLECTIKSSNFVRFFS